MRYFTLISIYFLLLFSCSSECKEDGSCCKISKAELILNQSQSSLDFQQETSYTESFNLGGMVLIPGGEFLMGAGEDEMALPREYPKHRVRVDAFYMDVHEVTNAQFEEFVRETGYVTVAEQPVSWEILKNQLPPNTPKPSKEALAPGSMVFKRTNQVFNYIDYSQWWDWIKDANWKQPYGPGSSIAGQDNYPVVHICYHDAMAYAEWCGKRLPTEAEWEWAARGGLINKIYPWGNESVEINESKCNFWTGTFPTTNTKLDGFEGVAPVMSYPSNDFGLYDMAGNVWEICSDWYGDRYYSTFDKDVVTPNPQGPKTWNFPPEPYDPKRVMRGGSFLCNDSYCSSYRVSARMPFSQSSGSSHTGFRCVKNH